MGLFDQFPYADLHEINLDWVIHKLREILEKDKEQDTKIQSIITQLEELSQNLGEEVDKWLREQGAQYVLDIVANYITTSVYFGLTQDGYWTAYIPESWKTINFNTTELDISVPIQPQYGHLVLSY